MDFPLPPSVDRDGLLTDNEMTLILDSNLKKARRSDPTILAFIEEFVRCKNIAESSAAVGIKASIGYKIRHYADVANTIQKIIDRSAIKYGFDASEIMERTKEIVDFDPISVQNPDGTYKSNLHDIEPSARRNIKKLKVRNLYNTIKDMNGMDQKIIVGEVIEYEFYDKLKAVDLAGKEKEMFKNTTRVEHTVTKNMEEILLASARRGTQETVGFQGKTFEASAAKVVESKGESDGEQ